MENDKENQDVRVEVIENGPLRITGKFIMKDLKRDKEESPGFIELCRCGRSRNKPYCDGSHERPE